MSTPEKGVPYVARAKEQVSAPARPFSEGPPPFLIPTCPKFNHVPFLSARVELRNYVFKT